MVLVPSLPSLLRLIVAFHILAVPDVVFHLPIRSIIQPLPLVRADSQLSLGDARSYYLSTAANELGVIWAKSEVGNVMVPVSYQDMEDSKTGKVERRKVAKPEDV